jgi:hypothetical protein
MVASEMEKRGKEAVVGGGLHLLAIPHGDNGGGALSGEQRPEKVLQGSWREVVRERGGVEVSVRERSDRGGLFIAESGAMGGGRGQWQGEACGGGGQWRRTC